jgi:hypothetical protein
MEHKKEIVKKWLDEYKIGFINKGIKKYSENIDKLISCVEFSQSKESLEMINHFYKIRNDIQVNHINKNNFDKKYKKLNEKISYLMVKWLNNVYMLDYSDGSQINRIYIFKLDLKIYESQINNRKVV